MASIGTYIALYNVLTPILRHRNFYKSLKCYISGAEIKNVRKYLIHEREWPLVQRAHQLINGSSYTSIVFKNPNPLSEQSLAAWKIHSNFLRQTKIGTHKKLKLMVFVVKFGPAINFRRSRVFQIAGSVSETELNINLWSHCLRGIAYWINHALVTQAPGFKPRHDHRFFIRKNN